MFKALILFFLLAAPLCAGTIDPNIPDEKYVEFGKKFECVVGVFGTKSYGSGVAIDDHHILTAAHVVDGSDIYFAKIGDRLVLLQEIVVHKDFNRNKFGIGDIALCFTKEKLDLKFYPGLYETDEEVGKVCSMSGYGMTGNFNKGVVSVDEKKRAGSNRVDCIDAHLLICSPSRLKEKGRTSLEYLICSGDSGGGLFIGSKLAGIHSCIIGNKEPKADYDSVSGHTRVSKYIQWIKANVKQVD